MELAFEKLAAPSRSRAEQRQHDLQLWQAWNERGRQPEDLRPLLGEFRGMIRSEVNKYSGRTEVPPAAINAEFNKQFVRALDTYRPDKGASLGTWVHTNLRKGKRWVESHKNIARIGEQRIYKVGPLNNATAQLDEQLGREPTTHELADHLGWSPKEVSTLQSEIRKSLVASAWEFDPVEIAPSKEKEALYLVDWDLTPEEQLVKHYLLGEHGKPELKPMEISRTLGYSPSKVTRLKQSIGRKTKKYL